MPEAILKIHFNVGKETTGLYGFFLPTSRYKLTKM